MIAPACSLPSPAAPRALTVFLPREHGSWFLLLEPLALGLLVAPSGAGASLGLAALAAFFMRRPLKPALAAVHSLRRREAREVVVMWSAVAVAALAEVLVLGPVAALWPLVPAGLLGAYFLRADLAGEARTLDAEVAGAVAFALLPAAVALLGGATGPGALAIAAVAAARVVPSILVVRACLRGDPAWLPALASFAAWAGLTGLAARGWVPVAAPLLSGLLLGRAAWLLVRRAPGWPARRLGQVEAILGVAYVLVVTANWTSP